MKSTICERVKHFNQINVVSHHIAMATIFQYPIKLRRVFRAINIVMCKYLTALIDFLLEHTAAVSRTSARSNFIRRVCHYQINAIIIK